MYEFLEQLARTGPLWPYLIIIGILVLSGFGLPLPEDIPIIIGGYLCGVGYANPWIMLPGIYFAILFADWFVFFLGRRYGHHVPNFPLLRRFLTEQRLARAEMLLHRHGGKYVFAARFMPGLRTPLYFSAGIFKLPHWKFLTYDFMAATISVPVLFGLAFALSDHIDSVRHWVAEGKTVATVVVVAVVVLLIGGKLWMIRRNRRKEAAEAAANTAASEPDEQNIDPQGVAEGSQ